ncbi:hypothetical protein SAMN05421736_106179 [Evansella caseinilytica]|uniref:GerMN domain-containing protein n=1 Tax=Evansella caseinilytica TaxID=1503961 RepID=A0A1H3QHY7_9BACI|nr:hypothetical protein [Evansella caseinilytica]SDZ12741.1 hypothetical protein SAMN05421736_106179 [Evansella caseinilytica]
MTRKSSWDEKKITSHLQQLPPVKDRRSKEEVFQAVQQKLEERETEDRGSLVGKKKSGWLLPAIASTAAVLLLLILLPSFLNNQQHLTSDSGGEQEASMENRTNEVNILMEDGEAGAVEEDADEAADNEEAADHSGEMNVTVQAETVLVPIPHTEQVEAAATVNPRTFVKREPLEMSEETGETLEEMLVYVLTSDQFGTADIFQGLQTVAFDEGDKAATLDFTEENRLESLAGDEYQQAYGTIVEVFSSYGLEEVRLTVNGEADVTFGPEGQLEKIELLPDNRGYYLYKAADGNRYFLRGAVVGEQIGDHSDTLFTFAETLEKMRSVRPDAWYDSAIPESVEFAEVVVDGDYATVELAPDSSFADDEQFRLMVSAIQLAASDFPLNYIEFEGAAVEQMTMNDVLYEQVEHLRLFD